MALITPSDYYQLSYGLGEYAREMTRLGWLTDAAEIATHKEKCLAEIKAAKAGFASIAGKDFDLDSEESEGSGSPEEGEEPDNQPDPNLNRGQRLADLFFVTWGVRAVYFSKRTGKPSLDKNALGDLLAHPEPKVRQAARFILRYREASKTLQFLSCLPTRAHYGWNVCTTGTKRWTCNALHGGGSIQQIKKPRRRKNEAGVEEEIAGLRNCFIADPEQWLVKADKSQLELRIVACLAGEKALLDVFSAGGDVHQATADMLGISRDVAKTYRYATTYGANDEKVHKSLVVLFPEITRAFVKEIMLRDKKQFPALEDYKRNVIDFARTKGYTYLPISNLRITHHFFQGKPSEIVNWRIQHTAADDVNQATLRVCDALRWPEEHLKAQIHDELVGQGPDPERLARILHNEMTSTFEYEGRSVSLPVEVKIGKRWGSMTKWKG